MSAFISFVHASDSSRYHTSIEFCKKLKNYLLGDETRPFVPEKSHDVNIAYVCRLKTHFSKCGMYVFRPFSRCFWVSL